MMKRMMSLAMAGLVTVSMMAGCGQVQTVRRMQQLRPREQQLRQQLERMHILRILRLHFCQMLSVIPAQQRGQME